MKKIILMFIVSLLAVSAFSQQKRIDSLQQIIQKNRINNILDTNDAITYSELGFIYLANNLEKAKLYGDTSLFFIRKIRL